MLTLEKQGDHLIMTIEGDGFLYNMVRTIAGMLLAVGNGWNTPADVKKYLNCKTEKRAAKPRQHTVCIWKDVTYED